MLLPHAIDRRHNGAHLAQRRLLDGAGMAEVKVATRNVREQIADGAYPQSAQSFLARTGHVLEPCHIIVKARSMQKTARNAGHRVAGGLDSHGQRAYSIEKMTG